MKRCKADLFRTVALGFVLQVYSMPTLFKSLVLFVAADTLRCFVDEANLCRLEQPALNRPSRLKVCHKNTL